MSNFFLSEFFHFLVVKFSVYLNKHVFLMAKDKGYDDDGDTLCRFSATFYEGDNICNFLFALLHTNLLLKGSTLNGRYIQ